MSTHIRLPKFDTLVALYQEDPAAYDNLRKKLLEDEVANAPLNRQAGLQELLKKIEIAHEKSKTPLEAAIMACLMMLESTIKLRTEIKNLQYLAASIHASIIIERVRNKSMKITRR